MIKAIIGLGNPGTQYEFTRHNIGFWLVDFVSKTYNAPLNKERRFNAYVGKVTFPEQNIFLIKPQTFMNLSGSSVNPFINFYQILASEILVVHDELDLPAGIAKFKFGGGSGGHNGLKDITNRLNTADYWRLRIGIGHPRDQLFSKQAVVDYVLDPPTLDEKILIDQSIERAIDVLPLIIKNEIEKAMMILHQRV